MRGALKGFIPISEETAQCYAETIQDAGNCRHTRTVLLDVTTDIYDNPLLHSEIVRFVANGTPRVLLKVEARSASVRPKRDA